MKTLMTAALLLSSTAFASDLARRPPSFTYADGVATFVDIQHAYYDITYDQDAKAAKVLAHITYESAEEGYPVFDSHAEPTAILLNGSTTNASLVSTPDKKTLVRVVNKKVAKGLHRLEIEVPLTNMVEFNAAGVKNGFFMGDLGDREYMEKYLPTNFVFDRIPMTLNLNFTSGLPQSIYSNGTVTKIDEFKSVVEFPAQLPNHSPYFHTVPVDTFAEREFSYTSIDGREIPVLIYSDKSYAPDHDALQALTLKVMAELEGDYGPFMHPSVLIQSYRGSGGMEYAGATQATLGSLAHELFHSYFARGVMPVDGNSGWLDEALARWRDNGYQAMERFTGTSNISALGTYNRLTDRRSYAFGSQVMAHFHNKFKEQGGLKPFLKSLVETRAFDPISTEEFVKAMNEFYGADTTEEFKHFVFEQPAAGAKSQDTHDHEFHQISPQQMKDLL